MVTQAHRDTRAPFPDAKPGTCRWCGTGCSPNRTSHTDCAEIAKASRDHREAMIDRAGGKPVCVFRHRSKCSGPIESHHPQELADNGDKTYTVPACKKHHNEETQRARAARAKRRGGKGQRERTVSKSKGKSSGGGGSDNEALITVIVFVLAGAGAIVYWTRRAQAKGQSLTDALLDVLPDTGKVTGGATSAARDVMPTLLLAAAWIAVGFVVAFIVRALLRRRRAEIARMAEMIARLTNTVPEEIRVRCGMTTASGSARYSSTFDDRPGTRTRAAVEEGITRKVGHPLTFQWQPARDTVRWSREHGDHGDDEAVPAEEIEVTPAGPDPAIARLQEALTHQAKAEVSVEVTERDEQGIKRMRIGYPSSVRDDSDETRAAWQDIIHAKVTGRHRPAWDTHGNVLTTERRPPMPGKIVRPLPSTRRTQNFLPIGVDEHGDEIGWDLAKSPHALMSGETGSGKTVILSGLILEASIRDWDIVIVDGKGTALAGFRKWPGVVRYGLGEAEDMHEAMVWVEGIMRERYRQVRDDGVDPATFKPILVVLDEFTEFSLAVKKWWGTEGAMENGTEVEDSRGNTKTIKSPLKEAPSIDSWSSIGRLGREGRVHIVVGIQQAAARIFGDTEKRDQLGYRLVAGPTTAESARMVFGRSDIGRDVPQDAKGRGTIVPVKGGPPAEVQAYWTPTPRPNGAMPEDPADVEILDAFRAAAPSQIVTGTIERAKVEVATVDAVPVEEPLPGSVWVRRTADLVAEGATIRHDGITAHVVAADYGEDDDGNEDVDTARIEVRLPDGSEEVWDFDSNDAVEVRA